MAFLPYDNFTKSASIIDKKRCWKQVIEAKQILAALENRECGKKGGWVNHPAVIMWEGYTEGLKHYFNIFLDYCKRYHNINTVYQYYNTIYSYPTANGELFVNIIYLQGNDKPWWMGNIQFHRAMRARLIEKDKKYYSTLFVGDECFNNGKYLWPIMDGSKSFKII